MFTIKSAADIRSAIGTIAASSKELQSVVHSTAVQCLAHVRDHGDWTLAASLLTALPSGQRVKGLAHWFNGFSNDKLSFSIDKESGSWVGKLAKDRTPADFDIEAAQETDYGDFSKEPNQVPLTMVKFLQSIEKVAKSDKKLKDGTLKVPPEVAALAAQMLSAIRAQPAAPIVSIVPRAAVAPITAQAVDISELDEAIKALAA